MNTPGAATPALRIEALHKRHARTPVLRGVDLEVAPGEILGLAGVNGAGKTTLIKCLLDFCSADSGRIRIFGQDARLPDSRERLAYLPERFVPPWYLKGEAFLRFALDLHGAAFDRGAALRTLEQLDLDAQALTRPVRQFSKGMTQKLGLAACVLSGKPLLVLDEPMSGLDPIARARLKQLLRQLRDEGRTIFFSTHALSDVDEIGDRLAILDAGLIRFVGTPAQCRHALEVGSLEQAFLKVVEQRRATLPAQAPEAVEA